MDEIRGTRPIAAADLWLRAAYENLLEGGIEAVRVLPLAKKLNLSRTSFYWCFKDRSELVDALLDRWKLTNTSGWIARTQAYADSVCEAVLNVIDCWFDVCLFDGRYEAAVRAWAQQSAEVAREIATQDAVRIAELTSMFERFECCPGLADVRARAMYFTQLGHAIAQPAEDVSLCAARIAHYVEVFTGLPPDKRELDRFFARRQTWPAGSRSRSQTGKPCTES